jgi:hypothetical protein
VEQSDFHQVPRDAWADGAPADLIAGRRAGPQRGSLTINHVYSPYRVTLDPDVEVTNAALKDCVAGYIGKLDSIIDEKLPGGWVEALSRAAMADEVPLQWLDVWPSTDQSQKDLPAPAIASWSLTRSAGSADVDAARERKVIMVAAEKLPGLDGDAPVSREYGLSVPVSISKAPDGRMVLTIRSMSAELPRAPFISLTELLAGALHAGEDVYRRVSWLVSRLLDANDEYRLKLAEHLNISPDFQITSMLVQLAGDPADAILRSVRIKGIGQSLGGASVQGAGLAFETDFIPLEMGINDEFGRGKTSGRPLTASALPEGHAHVLEQDPPSSRMMNGAEQLDWHHRRPTRPEDMLHRFRTGRRIAAGEDVSLESKDFRIRTCHGFVPGDPEGDNTKTLKLPNDSSPGIRSNDFSALMAFCNCLDFYQLIERLGITVAELGTLSHPQLQVFYRAGISPGPGKSGRTINARVSILHTMPKLTVEMYLGLANHSHRARTPAAAGGTGWAEPMGITCSQRWMWHEFGHVLLAGRLGRLEFDFAHSPGDAIAAVLADPRSRIAGTEDEGGCARLRGVTYPFVYSTRRHDRSVTMGWAWYGGLNRSLLEAREISHDLLKGYISEQILSSSMFRLYRILGGDTVRDGKADLRVRTRASLVTFYLLVDAIRQMAQSPGAADTLETALEQTEANSNGIRTLDDPAEPAPAGLPDFWRGGQASKVIRFAFEAQGMFPPNQAVDHNAPGLPPEVDIYLRDDRPIDEVNEAGMVRHGPGGYVPVSLDWDGDRKWMAAPGTVDVDNRKLTVGNRGHLASGIVSIRAWIGLTAGNVASDDWQFDEVIEWKQSSGSMDSGQTVGPKGEIELDLPLDPASEVAPAGHVKLLLVEVSCDQDKASSSPLCATAAAIANAGPNHVPPVIPRQLTDLVANDNNLALVIV